MQGAYNGFSKKLSEKLDHELIHIWCYAHVLNLVICDIINNVLTAISLFGLLQECATFFRGSHKRIDRWMERNKNKRLTLIGETRW